MGKKSALASELGVQASEVAGLRAREAQLSKEVTELFIRYLKTFHELKT